MIESRELRVAHLISGDLWAGAEVAVSHLLPVLASRPGFVVSLVALNEGELSARIRSAGLPVSIIPEARLSFSRLVRGVRAQLRGCDVVHAHRYKENILAAFSGCPWLATQHGLPEVGKNWAGAKQRAYDSLSLLALRYSARRVVAVSSEIEEWLKLRLRSGSVQCVHNGIRDPALTLPIVEWSDRPRVLGVVARLFPVKGIDLAIRALALCPGLELEIVGDGPLRGELERLSRAIDAGDRVRFLGHLADPLPRVSRWRGLLVTSLHEGNPIGVLEALALGTPIVSTRIRGVEEALAGQGGWLVDSRDPRRLAEEVSRRMSDETAAARVSSAARARYLDAFTVEGTADRLAALYREVSAEASR